MSDEIGLSGTAGAAGRPHGRMMGLLVEQCLNGVQFALLLFLMASGLTLIFGIMEQINLAHGSLFMLGAYFSVFFQQMFGSFVVALVLSLIAGFLVGVILELVVFRRLYGRDHLLQVIATFGLILIFNELVRIVWGVAPQYSAVPQNLTGSVSLGGLQYPAYRIAVIAASLATAVGLFVLIQKSRLGMLIRAGADDRDMVAHLGVNIAVLYTVVFGIGAALAALAGIMAGPLLSVRPGMGEQILILTFVVIVIGGLGSIQGALVGSLLIGLADTLGRAYLGDVMTALMPPAAVSALTNALSSTFIFLIMAAVLVLKPRGLFARRQR
jgi:branched-chain amino acid transport system permease protein